jgi:hypothetical protein
MFRAIQNFAVPLLLLGLMLGCADDTKYQYGVRGKWKLESRALPDGQVLKPPAVTGIYEWYPTSKTSAHVTASFASGPDKIQLSGFTCTLENPLLEAQGFTKNEYLNIGGGYRLAYQPVHTAQNKSSDGRVTGDGIRVIFEHADGTHLEYGNVGNAVVEEATFTVKFKDGTVDTWRRMLDQLGALPK